MKSRGISYDVTLAPYCLLYSFVFARSGIYNIGLVQARRVLHTINTFDIFLEAYRYVFYGFFYQILVNIPNVFQILM